jgi:hypothetical protein
LRIYRSTSDELHPAQAEVHLKRYSSFGISVIIFSIIVVDYPVLTY